jgi:hypothetical protein
MSDFSSTVQNAISNAGVALPSSTSQFNLSNANLSSSNLAGSSSSLLNGPTSSLTSLPGISSLTSSAGQYTSAFSSATSSSTSTVSNLVSAIGGTTASTSSSDNVDFRVRIRAQTAAKQSVYGPAGTSNILNILYNTNGMLFPFTPTISWSQAVEYDALHFTHSNQDYYVYKNTPSTTIDVSGQFTFQNQREGEYMLACMHFLRTVSKMYFGQQNPSLAGLPPPVLLFSGYGNYMFNDLPVIVKSHSYSLDNTVDYVTVNTAGGSARLPAIMTIQVQLIVQHTPQDLRTKFDLDQFRTGALMRNNTGWI